MKWDLLQHPVEMNTVRGKDKPATNFATISESIGTVDNDPAFASPHTPQ
jgi:hypothetical protein